MSVGLWWVNAAGLAAIALVIWWFWLSRPAARRAEGVIEVAVAEGVYTPARIEVPVGRATTLRFLRTDPSPCAQEVIFHGLGITATLPVGEPKDVTVSAPTAGEYEFTCQMRMYRGHLVAR